ncbi:MAG: CocE/NonD family hydrolase [Candidatus Thermoplasmatota archaeon]|nr:CocE/NonD family hydrolase [Candidatus Thermoplasmatota archaeon]MEC9147120.1 CocE/NonD family hydrolase [Candidatus Thermoplasmatota archaeon]
MVRCNTAIVLILVLISPTLSGCSGPVNENSDVEQYEHWLPPVEERSGKEYRNDDVFSRVSINGTYDTGDVQSIFVPVPSISVSDGGAGFTGGAEVHLGLWLPEKEGCDLTVSEVLEECKVPVIAEIGPYYDDGDVDALTPANRLGRFLIENYVQHGYGVAQVSVFGTGQSNHCMDLMGHDEQAGIKAAVDWLGSQPWSNGRVGAIGKSYDGSTPWNAAASGSDYLATIVPMSGLIGVHDLMWRNGSMEARGAIMHNGVYGSFGLDGDSGDIENACEGYVEGYYAGPAAYLTGDNLAWTGSDYWEERHFLSRALEIYNGSIYIIHGLQDWNVDPHMAFPAHQMSVDAGFDVKGLYGQWAHDYPDRDGDAGHASLSSGRGAEAYPYTLRWDWADDMLEWFDFYLMNKGPKPRLVAEVQDNIGGWRVEETYPPPQLDTISLTMDECQIVGGSDTITSSSSLRVQCPEFDSQTRIVGTPTIHLEATISQFSTSGHLFVEMIQASTEMHLGHAVMDLRFHEGGKQGSTLLPGSTVIAKMEFFGMDVVVPEGDAIQLIISQTGEDYVPSPVSTSPVTLSMGSESVLNLPSVNRQCSDLFLPPMQDPYPQCIV